MFTISSLPRAPEPPATREILFARADRLAGWHLYRVAERLEVPVPPDLRREKGWVGLLLERALGATAGSRAEPDFPHLGVELKTIPLSDRGVPRQSTYVCTAPLDGSMSRTWRGAWARRKLARVLWVPILGEGPLATRRLGAPLLWSPDRDEEATLRADWRLLSGLLHAGEFSSLHAGLGVALQIRPKAAHGRVRVRALDADGAWVQVNPRGFYLRRSFTSEMLARRFLLPSCR